MSHRVSLGLALGVFALAGCGKKTEKAPAAAKVANPVGEAALTTVTLTADAVRRLGIETAVIDSQAALPTRTVGGEIVVPPGHSVVVSAPVAGRVLAPEAGSFPPPGARVMRGAPLLRISPLPPDIAQTTRDNDIAAARLRQAQAEADRSARLFTERLVSARENERAQAELAAARATAASAAGQHNIVRGGAAGGSVATLSIASPSDGVIRLMNAAPGQTVAAGAPLLEVMRTDRLWVRVPLYAGDANRVRRGAPASVHGLGGSGTGTTIVASPVAAPPSADANAASVDLFYELRSTGTLRPGERVGVTVPLTGSATEVRALSVPLTAVVRDLSGGSWVYERKDSLTFIRRRVEVSRVNGGNAILAQGPKAGTKVVTSGSAELFGTEFGAGK
ncbi:MAG: secretion protein HlyD family protein [Gemmatimonadetes bacterium]|nr:secretion protein HlyD family protein [Gemmatimonadota bacterium]